MRQAYPWITVFLFLGCLFLGYVVLQQKTEILQVTLGRSDADRAVRGQVAEAEQRLAAAKAAQAQAAKSAAQAKPPAVGAQAGAQANRDGNTRIVHISDIIKEHPEFAAIMAEQQRRGVLSQFGPLLSTFNLSPDQITRIKALLIERSQAGQDAEQAAKAAGLTQGTPAWRDAIKQAQGGVEAEMSAVVGTDGGQFAAQLQNEASAQNTIRNTYSSDFADAGVDLTADQTLSLTQAMANASYGGKSTAGRPANYNDVDSDTMLTPHDNRILTAAAATLSPAQLEIVKTDMKQVHQQAAIIQQYSAGANGRPVTIVP